MTNDTCPRCAEPIDSTAIGHTFDPDANRFVCGMSERETR
jgi:hypothetical protein